MDPNAAISKSDLVKRTEIYSELIYYMFDSFIIPLIRFNFHVTESNAHRNRLFYFRHDVWRSISEPALARMRTSMFEEIKLEEARRILDRRPLGFSQVRLLPKETGLRPIMNLRRRVMKTAYGRMILGRSINSVISPVYSMLSYEKSSRLQPSGSALYSVGDMYAKIKSFKERLRANGSSDKTLYFAKLDVQSCFDTIPQRHLLAVVEKIVSQDEYSIARHTEIRVANRQRFQNGIGPPAKPTRKFVARAKPVRDLSEFEHVVNSELATKKKKTVFVNSVVPSFQKKDRLLQLLGEHVGRNLVKIGKKYYRQKEGIPQGSVLSTTLCSFFYGELETECLDFLDCGESLLLRLVDDFLLISTNKEQARKFLAVMHGGVEKYGVKVNAEKSLTNFDCTIDGTRIPTLNGSRWFPYCGSSINTSSLEIARDRQKRKRAGEQS